MDKTQRPAPTEQDSKQPIQAMLALATSKMQSEKQDNHSTTCCGSRKILVALLHQ